MQGNTLMHSLAITCSRHLLAHSRHSPHALHLGGGSIVAGSDELGAHLERRNTWASGTQGPTP